MTMMTGSAGAAGRGFELSRVGELTFDIVRRDFMAVYGLAFGIGVVPALLRVTVFRGMLQSVQAGSAQGGRHLPAFLGPGLILSGFVGLIAILLLYGALSWGAAERMQQRAPTAGEQLGAGLRALPVLIGLGLLTYFALTFATLLLVFPALMLASAWAVIVPAVVNEKAGVFAAYRRSGELTKGHRWKIFLLLLIYWVASLIVSGVVAVLVRAMIGASGSIFAAQTTGPALYASTLINLLVGSLVNAVGAVGAGVLYHELRALKGGFDPRRLSDVFA